VVHRQEQRKSWPGNRAACPISAIGIGPFRKRPAWRASNRRDRGLDFHLMARRFYRRRDGIARVSSSRRYAPRDPPRAPAASDHSITRDYVRTSSNRPPADDGLPYRRLRTQQLAGAKSASGHLRRHTAPCTGFSAGMPAAPMRPAMPDDCGRGSRHHKFTSSFCALESS
jgi:hypothetical protein